MAAVVESVAFPRTTPPVLQRTPPRSAAMASVSAVSAGPRLGSLLEARGLRISGRPVRTAAVDPRVGRAARRGAVVCEAPEATVKAYEGAQQFAGEPVPVVTKSTWQSLVMGSDRMVLVSFWAPWCGPCRMMHPVIAEIAAEYSGKLSCFELDTDESPDIATEYGIRSIPTVIFFKEGEKKDAIIGAVPKSTLVATIQKFL